MKSGVQAAAHLVHERAQRPGFRPPRAAMLTTTYREDAEWNRRHLSSCLERIVKWAARKGHVIPYVWVAELTKRGRMHYHVVLWLPRGLTIPKPDKQGWWPHGHTRIEWAKSPVGYLMKYASKGTADGEFPPGARIHGAGGLDRLERMRRRWCVAPSWIREAWPEWTADPIPTPGGGWMARATGEWRESPYELLGFDGRHVLIRLRSSEELSP